MSQIVAIFTSLIDLLDIMLKTVGFFFFYKSADLQTSCFLPPICELLYLSLSLVEEDKNTKRPCAPSAPFVQEAVKLKCKATRAWSQEVGVSPGLRVKR